MGKKKQKSWFSLFKGLFLLEKHSKTEKKEKRSWKWTFGRLKVKRLASITAPSLPTKEEPCERRIQAIVAAIRIQTTFRGFLARKALRALKGIVKLQAIIRGQSIRRQAMTTLKCLESMLNIQSQVRARRLQLTESTYQFSDCKEILPTMKDKIIKVDAISTQRRRDDRILKKEAIEATSKQEDKAKHLELRTIRKLKHVEEQVHSPPRRSLFLHKKQISEDNFNLVFPVASPRIPTYMVATESAKAKARSVSSPRARLGSYDTQSESYSPYKHNISLRNGGPSDCKTRSPRLTGDLGPVKSSRSLRDLGFNSDCYTLR